MLAVFIMVIGVSVIVRDRQNLRLHGAQVDGPENAFPQAALGGAVAVASGMFGIGGPMISAPTMVIAGYSMLAALAAAQAQSIVIAGTGTVGYLSQGSICWRLAAITGVPELIGVWLGWKVARAVPARPLKYFLAATLIVLGPVLMTSS